MINSDALFIVGAGRTGTNLLASILNSYSNVFDINRGKENKFILKIISNAIFKKKPYPFTAMFYFTMLTLIAKFKNKVLIDQCHPNIFYIKDLLKINKDLKFIFINRETIQSTSSMLEHPGVLSWYKNKNIEFPNDFLGYETYEKYNSDDLVTRCATRQINTKKLAFILKKQYPKNFCIINFNNLILDFKNEIRNIEYELDINLGRLKSYIDIDKSVTTKHKIKLDKKTLKKIERLELLLFKQD
jgi:hypothetical protein